MATATDTESALLEKLDFESPCTVVVATYVLGRRAWVSRDCGKPARWVLRCRSCRRVGVACDEHAAFARSQPTSHCGHCQVNAPGWQLWIITPLDGVS